MLVDADVSTLGQPVTTVNVASYVSVVIENFASISFAVYGREE